MVYQWVQMNIRELAADERQEGSVRPRFHCLSE